MGFFQGAYDFEITGGNFYDIKGNQINRIHDGSIKVGGSQNNLEVKPDMSRQDNRTYNTQEHQMYAAYSGPEQGSTSTYPGYGQMPPMSSPMPHNQLNQQAIDPQAVVQYQQWMAFQQWRMYMEYVQQQQQQQQQQTPPQSLAQENPYQQPAQPHAAPAPQPNEHLMHQDTSHRQLGQDTPAPPNEQAPVTEAECMEEDEDVTRIRQGLERQHIDNSRKSK